MARKKSYIQSFVYLIVVILLIGVIGAVAYFTNNFTTEPNVIIVTVDSKILLNDSIIEPSKNEPTTFSITSMFGQGVELKVVQSVDSDKDFSYKVDGSEVYFSSTENFTSFFDITSKEGSFVIDFSNVTMKYLLTKYHNGATVTDVPIVPSGVYFSLVFIDSSNTSNTLNVGLKNITNIAVTGVDLQEELLVWFSD